MAYRRDPDADQIIGRQIRENRLIYVVIAKRSLVLT